MLTIYHDIRNRILVTKIAFWLMRFPECKCAPVIGGCPNSQSVRNIYKFDKLSL